MPLRPVGENIPVVNLVKDRLIQIDYTFCDIIDADVMEAVRNQIVSLINDHDVIQLLVNAGTVSQFVFDVKTLAKAPRPFTIRQSAWLVDPGNVYPITRMLDSLDIEYPVQVFVDRSRALQWLADQD